MLTPGNGYNMTAVGGRLSLSLSIPPRLWCGSERDGLGERERERERERDEEEEEEEKEEERGGGGAEGERE